jgi:SAM-dependent methyltransferase
MASHAKHSLARRLAPIFSFHPVEQTVLEQPLELRPNTSPTADLYTELPYPADGVTRTTNARLILAGTQRHAPQLLGGQKLRIVDVGCGTGEHTVGLARFFPQAHIVGCDINAVSLKMARDLAQRERVAAKFVQCDITRDLADRLAEVSPGPFDVVCSAGVLHHLADPHSGFTAVREIISPSGLFYCYPYTHYGRREEIAIKALLDEFIPGATTWQRRSDAISLLGISNTHTLWRALARMPNRFKYGPPFRPLELVRAFLKRNRLAHSSDSYSNPCEHLYRFDEIKALLIRSGWTFVAVAKHAGLPTTPAARPSWPCCMRYPKARCSTISPSTTRQQDFAFSHAAAPRLQPADPEQGVAIRLAILQASPPRRHQTPGRVPWQSSASR